MLQAELRKKRTITKVYRQENILYLESEAGFTRIIPQDTGILRISYAKNNTFSETQGEEAADPDTSCQWTWQEDDSKIRLSTGSIQAEIDRYTGSIRFLRSDGSLLLAERNYESKNVEEFDVFQTLLNENTEIEKIQTPDGIKQRIRQADRTWTGKRCHTRLYLTFEENERLYGLGQAEEGVWNLRHTTQYLHPANLKIPLPVLLSDKNWGILLSTQSPAVFNDTQYGSYLHTEADSYLDYYFIAAETPGEITAAIRKLTGRAALLPKWAFGYMQSKERYEDAQDLLAAAEEFRRRKIGLDTLILDWMSWPDGLWGQKSFDASRFPDPDDMIHKLHNMGIHFMISIWPTMDEKCDNYREFQEKGLLLATGGIYNAFSPEGRRLYWEQVKKGLFAHGVDAWWCDSSEPLTPEWSRDMKPEAGEMYREYVAAAADCMPPDKSAAYGLYHARALYEGQRSCTEARRVVNLTRSGWMGSQKYGTILWSGDISASWETLRKQIVAGLQFCICGLPYWTLDIGAFFVKRGIPWFWDGGYDAGAEDAGYRELYVRWFQYGAFLPVFRSHGTDCPREPWQFGSCGDPFYEALCAAIRLRYRLLPYIYSTAGAVWKEDAMMMQPLFFEFPADTKAADVSDEFMLGPSLLVCPVTKPMRDPQTGAPGNTRTVYLPAGSGWYDLKNGHRYEGGQYIQVSVQIDSIPVYVKEGSILPVTQPGENSGDMEGQDILLMVYAGKDASYTLYEDAGDGYGYEKGEYCLTNIRYDDAAGTVHWDTEGDTRFRKGSLSAEIITGSTHRGLPEY
ncbi:MAG: DUF5110 domain-containing protein [Lachnospiraceae bacterium]|nr:DUF5110 domain-containing protein [Lachnospiraceae bacterium]